MPSTLEIRADAKARPRLLAGVDVAAPDGLGAFVVAASAAGVASISYAAPREGFVLRNHDAPQTAHRLARDAAAQLREYFSGGRRSFSVPLDLHGTEFQLTVWRALAEIPYGTTTTYGNLAADLGKPGAARAVGLANHDNPIAIVVPCHRVIGANGSLTGYAGGLHVKRWLLDHESGNAPLWRDV